ncbi:MAG: PadR family transcriptional regulator [Frankiaceae bacterium]
MRITDATRNQHYRHHQRHHHREGFPGPFGPGYGHEFAGPRRGGRRGGRGWPGPGGWPGPMFGAGPRGARVRRGDVRTALLALLAEQPMHGYQMIGELSERSGGAWRPSPGSVYPVLQMLEDEGLVRLQETEGRRVYHLTDAGRAVVEARRGEPTPWDAAADAADDGVADLRPLVLQVGAAALQVAHAGTEQQVAAAREALTNVRRALYRILAEDEAGGSDEAGTGKTS